ncbi:hypothetical protein CNECB9_910002 [Cupriavidus necator]|uniref:Uncharacterized protein n=1 Tax=Cupriavidus necator TaxID=106590 RepID=A0A1K0IT14_CUPNE|nr:hypothetical protein CNECB9_910002 [Cupriavidus necator]
MLHKSRGVRGELTFTRNRLGSSPC